MIAGKAHSRCIKDDSFSNDHESHRIADNVREKTERLTEQLRLQAYGREQAIERSEHRWVVIDEADYSVGGRQDSR